MTFTTNNNYVPKSSPDGTKIVWQSGPYGANAEIWIMNSDGTALTQLTNNTKHDGNPNFSHDGTKIVYEGWDNDNYPEVFIMKADGTNKTQLTSSTGAFWNSAPVFHPSGNSIYFLKGFNADDHIAKMDVDGSNIVSLTGPNTFGYAESYINFSADGKKMVFLTTKAKGYNKG